MKGAFVMLAAVVLSSACSTKPQRSYAGGISPSLYDAKVEMEVLELLPASDTPPIARIPAQVAIGYPSDFFRARISGEVLATMVIEEDGTVSSVTIKKASQAEFGQWLTARASHLGFFPTKRGGRTIRSSVDVRVTVSLVEQ